MPGALSSNKRIDAMFFNPRTTKTLAFATGALLLPAIAHAQDHTIERDGVTYVYTISTEKGRTVIAGTADRLTPFRLVVRGQHVTGDYNGKQVFFTLRDVKANAEAVAVR
jgi:hypothetical protein